MSSRRQDRRRERTPRGRPLAGEEYDVEVGPVAHGGHCVARHEGRVVFVRHALPGERVRVRVTDGEDGSRFLLADAVAVHEASPDRVEPPCPWAGPGRCGGCDLQHASLDAQRRLKGAVVAEQLRRLAGIDREVVVESVPGDAGGLDWRTRLTYAVDDTGRAGLRRHHSHDVVPVDDCRIAHPDLPEVLGRDWPGVDAVSAVVSGTGERLRIVSKAGSRPGRTAYDGPAVLHERADGRELEVSGSGFWQVHPGAADTLVTAVLAGLAPTPGDRAVDLYAGVGLFTVSLADRVGPTGTVVAVEADPTAVADAGRNLAGFPQATVEAGPVYQVLSSGRAGPVADLVVLDPPRTGAKAGVVGRVAALGPRRVAYVACDPAALARDLATFAERGYVLRDLRAFDLFPMTHHVECVAVLEPLVAV